MLKTTIARLLKKAYKKSHKEKKSIVLPEVIFKYLVSSPKLTASEKLAWLVIQKTVQCSPDLTACVSYQQIGQAINVTKDTAYRLVRGLKEQQFLLSSLNNTKNKVIYTTNLPRDGVALLKQAIQDKLEEEKNLEIKSDSEAASCDDSTDDAVLCDDSTDKEAV